MPKKFRLTGKTKHGKNRIRENGEIWRIEKGESRLQPSRTLISSVRTGNMRWIRTDGNDEHFEVEKIQ